jgi:hypothetical protein
MVGFVPLPTLRLLLVAELGVEYQEDRKKYIWKKGKEHFHFDSFRFEANVFLKKKC